MTLHTHEEAGTQNTPQNHFAWREVAPLQYSRPLGDMEKVFVAFSTYGRQFGTECAAIDGVYTFTYEPATESNVIDAMRHALKLLRLEFLTLGATVDGRNQTMNYHPITSNFELEAWIDETFHVVPWPFKPFDAVSLPKPSILPGFYLGEKTPGSNEYELVLHSAHWRMDGIGTHVFVNRLFNYLSSGAGVTTIPSVQQQVERLPPTIEEIGSIPTTPSPEATALVTESAETMSSHMPSAGMALSHSPSSPPGPVQNAHVIISKEATTSLMRRCKSKGVRFNPALNAAFVLALRKITPESHKNRDYVGIVPVSIRSMLPKPYNGEDYSVSASVLSIPLVQPRGLGFHELAENFQRTCNVKDSPEFLNSVRARTSMFHSLVGWQPPEEWGPITTALFNPMGDLGMLIKPERDFGVAKVSVTQVLCSTHIIGRENPVYAYTFRGQLNLTANYNEAYYSHEELIRFMEIILDTFDEQLKPERQARL